VQQLAPASFLVDVACQNYGMFSSPNMKDIHDLNMSFFSPQPFFIAAFFFPQQLFQLAWLYRLYKLDPKKKEAEKEELDQLVDFVPFYSVGNLCIAGSNLGSLYSRTSLTLPSSMDGGMELISSGRCSCLCYHQHLDPAILHDSEAAALEPTLDILHPHSHCLQNICWNWCLGLLAQRIRCLL
jgi:hypothetical protein